MRPKVNKIIIHFHGGDFISQSSNQAQPFLRKWTNALGVPIFSVDYRLAPKNPYPDPINDAYQGYYWIVTQVLKHMNIHPEKIVVCGDSAGGHLACAVTSLAILRGFRVPDGIILHYPTCSSNINHFFPSTLLTLDDPLLNFSLMFYIASALTRSGGDSSKNCILSPIYTPKSVLKMYPPVKIFVAEVDPLRDHGVYLGLNMKRAGVDIEVFYMKEYIHNFLQFQSSAFGIPEYQQAHDITIAQFKKLLDS